MPGSITPLPILAELDAEDRAAYNKLQAPKSMVVRYGAMRMVAELPYDGDAKPGCGSKLVIRNNRGIELAEMLTTTCGNAGCGKSVSRKQMLEYIDNSGGRDYPFSTQGRVLRVATIEDLNQQAAHEALKPEMVKFTKSLIAELGLQMKLVDIELLLGMERIIFHYTAEEWVDFRDMVQRLATEYRTRIEMHQVNARDEARIVADFEKCGQHCCCRQFLKVLKPVSMRSAKVQKATLDPTKISGRCGRLMCCLRYEDETYESLRKRLPKKNTRVRTDDGPGTVIDTQILTQLALVLLDNVPAPAAYPVENLETLPREEDPMFNQPRAEGAPAGGPGAPTRGGGRAGGQGGPGGAGGAGPGSRGGRLEGRSGGQGQGQGQRQGSSDGGAGNGASGEDVSGAAAGAGAGEAGAGDGRRRRGGEPRRPRPGAPLGEHEIESREAAGAPTAPDAPPIVGGTTDGGRPPATVGGASDASDAEPLMQGDAGDTDDAGGDDVSGGDASTPGGESGTESGTEIGPDGQPRRRRRRRRRGRGRGRGGPGGPEGASGDGTGPGPAPGGGGDESGGRGGPRAGGEGPAPDGPRA